MFGNTRILLRRWKYFRFVIIRKNWLIISVYYEAFIWTYVQNFELFPVRIFYSKWVFSEVFDIYLFFQFCVTGKFLKTPYSFTNLPLVCMLQILHEWVHIFFCNTWVLWLVFIKIFPTVCLLTLFQDRLFCAQLVLHLRLTVCIRITNTNIIAARW